jgi:hypothetical protein
LTNTLKYGDPPRKDYIPAIPLRRIVSDWMEKDVHNTWEILAARMNSKHMQYPYEQLYSPRRHDGWVNFDFADRLLVALGDIYLWYSEPELHAYYLAVKFVEDQRRTKKELYEEIRIRSVKEGYGSVKLLAKEYGIPRGTLARYICEWNAANG